MAHIQKGTYRHYKGNLYEVIGTALHSETMEALVVYRPLHDASVLKGNDFWIRPTNMFLEEVEVDGIKKPRFERVE